MKLHIPLLFLLLFLIVPIASASQTLVNSENFENNYSSHFYDNSNKGLTNPVTYAYAENPTINTSVSPTHAWRFELRSSDPPTEDGTRAELESSWEPPLLERWYNFSVYLPSGGYDDYTPDIHNAGEVIMQWHGNPDAGEDWIHPSLSVITDSYSNGTGHYYLCNLWDDNPISTDDEIDSLGRYHEYDLGSYMGDKGKWSNWAYHVKWSYNNSTPGFIYVYKNNSLIFSQTGPDTTNDQKGVNQQFGIYKWEYNMQKSYSPRSNLDHRVIYFDDVSVSNITNDTVFPVANFTTSVSQGLKPLNVQFTDQSTGATSWSWDFGDGYTSTAQNPSHTYTTVGTFNPTLTAINTNGTNSTSKTITALGATITVGPAGSGANYLTSSYANPSACFQAAINAANSGDTILVFNGTYSITAPILCANKNLNFYGSGTTIFNSNVPASENQGSGCLNFAGSQISSNTALTTNAASGATTITLPSVTSVKPGDLILIWNSDVWAPLYTDDTAGNYPDQLTGEQYQIIAVNSAAKTVTLNEPLLRAYPTSKSSQYDIFRPCEFHIDNININGPSNQADNFGLGLEYANNSTVTRCSVTNNGYNNIAIWHCWNVTVSNCFIENALLHDCGYGVACWSGSAYINVNDCTIKWCRHEITANTDELISLTRKLHYFNNTIWGGITTDRGSNCIDAHVECIDQDVENNIIHTNSTSGYWLYAFDDGAQNSKFINNTVYGGNGGMIDKRGLLQNCTHIYKNNTAIGVDGVIVQNSDALDPTNVCISELFDFENNSINQGDTAVWNGNDDTTGLCDSYKNIVVTNNTFSNINNHAINFYTSINGANFTVTGNKFTSIQGDGIYLNGNNHIAGKIVTTGNTMTSVNLGGTGSNTGIEIVNFASIPVYPTANVTENTTGGVIPFHVMFTDLSTHETSRLWDFGDGNTSSVNPVTHTYYTAGNYTVTLTATNSNGSDVASVVVHAYNQYVPTLTWNNPVAIDYGTALTNVQLNAVAKYNNSNVSGTYVYNPISGTILDPGNQTLNCQFTPTDTYNYTSASKSVYLTVNPAPIIVPNVTVPDIYNGTLYTVNVYNTSSSIIDLGRTFDSSNVIYVKVLNYLNGLNLFGLINIVGTIAANDSKNISMMDITKNNNSSAIQPYSGYSQLNVNTTDNSYSQEFIISNNALSNNPSIIDRMNIPGNWSVQYGSGTPVLNTSGGWSALETQGTTDANGRFSIFGSTSLNLSKAHYIEFNMLTNVTGTLRLSLSDGSATTAFNGVRFTLTPGARQHFVLPFNGPENDGIYGMGPDWVGGSNLSAINRIYVGIENAPSNTPFSYDIDNITYDSGSYDVVEAAVPDNLATTSAKLEVWNYVNGAYQTVGTYGLNGSVSTVSSTSSNLVTLNDTAFDDMYGTGKGFAVYPKGIAGQIVTGSDGSTYTYNASNTQGSQEKIAMGFYLPPSDQGRSDNNKIRTKLTVYGNTLRSSYNYSVAVLQTALVGNNVFSYPISGSIIAPFTYNITGYPNSTWNNTSSNPVNIAYGGSFSSINVGLPTTETINGNLFGMPPIYNATVNILTNYNLPTGNLQTWSQNYTQLGKIPSNVFAGSLSNLPFNASSGYNSSIGAIDYNSSAGNNGYLFVGSMYPTTEENLTIDLGINSTDQQSGIEIEDPACEIMVEHRNDGTYRVLSYYTDSTGTLNYPDFYIPVNFINNNHVKISIIHNDTSRMNTISLAGNSQYSVTTPYYSQNMQNMPFATVNTPIIEFYNYINSGWCCSHVYSISQSIPRYVVTPYPSGKKESFGLYSPRSRFNKLGTNYLASKGIKGTVWAEASLSAPSDLAYEKSLLDQGWELGIRIDQPLSNFNVSAGEALIDSEYATVFNTYGQSPVSWTAQSNSANLTFAQYAYQKYGMIWADSEIGNAFLANVGSLTDSTWHWWGNTSSGGIIYPSYSVQTDQEAPNTPADSISFSNFSQYVNSYNNSSTDIIGFGKYYSAGLVQNTTTSQITILENDATAFKFLPVYFGDSYNVNVNPSFNPGKVYRGNVLIAYTYDSNGVTFTVSSNEIYSISRNITIGKTGSGADFNTSNYSNDSSCFQTAFDSAKSGDLIKIFNGSYTITDNIQESNKSLYINGSGATILNFNIPSGTDKNSGGLCLSGYDLNDTQSLSIDALQNTSIVKLPSIQDAKAGELVKIWNDNQWDVVDNAAQKTGEIYQIQSVNSGNDSLTLSDPLVRNYTASNSHVDIIDPIEVHINNISTVGSNAIGSYTGICLDCLSNSSVTNCTLNNSGYSSLSIWHGYNVSVANNYISNSLSTNSGSGISMLSGSAYGTITNNMITACRHSITADSDDTSTLTRGVVVKNNNLNGSTVSGANVIRVSPYCIDSLIDSNIISPKLTNFFALEDGGFNTIFSNNNITGGYGAVERIGSLNNSTHTIQSNKISGITGFGYQGNTFSSGLTLTYWNNTQNSGNSGMFLTAGESYKVIDIQYNSFSNLVWGTYIYNYIDISNFTVKNNAFTNIQKDGIYLNGMGHRVYRIWIKNNTMNNVDIDHTASPTGIEIVNFSYVPTWPDAYFTENVTSGYTPFSVQFTDTSVNETSRLWDFGDGGTSILQNPVHTYVTPGNYTVTLAATNANGTDYNTSSIIAHSPYIDNTPIGDLTLYSQNFSASSTIPAGVMGTTKYSPSHAAYNASLSYNNNLHCIDFNKSYYGSGMLILGNLTPTTTQNLTMVVGINGTSTSSEAGFYSTTFTVYVRHMTGDAYNVYSFWTDDAGVSQYSYYTVPVEGVINNRIPISIYSYDNNRTNVVQSYNQTYSVETPYSTKDTRELPYPVVSMPVIAEEHYISDTGYATLHLYLLSQSIPKRIVTQYSPKNIIGFGLDGPYPENDINGTNYLTTKGYHGTVWADPATDEDPLVIAYHKSLLAKGWELGMHFSTPLNSLPLQDAYNLIDAEYTIALTVYGQAPTSWCSLQNGDEIEHALYAYQKYGMLWRNGPMGVLLISNVGNLDNDTWPFWSSISSNKTTYPCFTHMTDYDSPTTIQYSIDSSKFKTWVDNYKSSGIKIGSFSDYYTSGEAQADSQINLNVSNSTLVVFDALTNGTTNTINVVANFTPAKVSKNSVSIPFTNTVDGTKFNISSSGRYSLFLNSSDPTVSLFSANNTFAAKPATIQFTDNSLNYPTSWLWSFGDGNTSTQQNPVHTYNRSGVFTVTLATNNAIGGDINKKLNYIIVVDTSKHDLAWWKKWYHDHGWTV